MSERERWRPVAGLETRYEVSNHGRVRRLVPMGRMPAGSYINSCFHCSSGRALLTLTDADGRRVQLQTARAVLMAFAPVEDAANKTAEPLNGDHGDIRLENLRWAPVDRSRRKTRQAQTRACMCCGRPFKSTGSHHRLCGSCRTLDGDDPFDAGLAQVHDLQPIPLM